MQGNLLEEIPLCFTELKSLERLDIKYNKFKYFPEEVLTLENIMELDVSGNNLSLLPRQLLNLKKLELLMIRDNPLLFKGNNKIYNQQLIKELESNKIIVKYLIND